ncbi:MAG TPA: zf-HC2 domain-containing protein [Candidatus Eisenbacteria bacterium]|nr:zf-HC2 domain-containing protein [Candidatus Eisenbacteria bacterium]
MDCSEAKPELERYASGRLTPIERLPIEEHVSMCEECSHEVELIRKREAAPAEGRSGGTDWTVEKIFGAGDAGAAPRTESAGPVEGVMQGPFAGSSESEDDAADETPPSPIEPPRFETHAAPRAIEPPPPVPRVVEPPAPPVAPPADERPSMILPLPPAEPDKATVATGEGAAKRPARDRRAKGDAKPAAEGWDFEPAGANVEQTPPEETVQLAETALGRRKERSSAKSAATRALLWGFGGLAGIVLLGASVWLALTVHRAPAPPTVTRPYGGGAKTRTTDPGAAGIASPYSESVPAAGLEAPESDAGPIAASNAPPAAPPPLEPNPPSAAPRTAAPRTVAPQAVAPLRAPDAPKAPAKSPAGGTLARAATPPAGSGTTSGAVRKPSRPLDDDREMWPIDDPPAAAGPRAGRAPTVGAPAKPAPVDPGEGHAAIARRTPVPAPAAEDSAAAQAQPAKPAMPAKPATPLDRLHEATGQAASAGDLVALRKLREAWKSYLRSVVGPERSRAKREYADCLWAIQLLSGRMDDQRAALVAYRDFLLSAPAGGTDARSAARLRQLEDVMSERN